MRVDQGNEEIKERKEEAVGTILSLDELSISA